MEENNKPPAAGQKRQNSDNSGPASKKAHMSDSEVQIKILIPAPAVGALIGKGGEAMRKLKEDSGCRVQMSKNQEVYHGTNERICLVKGKVNSCSMVIQAIIDKIKEKADTSNSKTTDFDLTGFDRAKQMKLVVPNTSAGMVIGKSGASIKEIRESTGATIQVYPKAGSEEAKNSPERVITVGAETNQVLIDAVLKVLEKVAADPLHAQPIEGNQKSNFTPTNEGNNSSFDFNRQQNNNYGNLSQYPNNSNPVWQSQQSLVSDQGYGKMNQGGQFPPGPKMNPVQGMGNMDLLSFLDNLQSTLRTSGFNEQSVSEIMSAMQILAKYNIMGLGLGIGVATMAQMRQGDQPIPPQPQMMPQQQPPQQQYGMGPPQMMGGPPVMGAMMNGPPDDRNDSNLGGNTGGVLIDVMSQKKNGSESFAASVVKELVSTNDKIELCIADVVTGAVLGPKAKTLAEIQQQTNCRVEVHKRGSGSVPQGFRLISLHGDPKTTMNAKVMIERVINMEQARRTSNGRGGSGGGNF